MDDTDWDKKHWDDKRNYLVTDELPRDISHAFFSEKYPELGRINSVTRLAMAVGCIRQTLYDLPNEDILQKIRHLYKIPAKSECAGELKAGSCEDFVKEYRALHADGSEQSQTNVTLVLLAEDMFADTVKTETRLASLSLRTGQSKNAPGQISLGFDLNCPEDTAFGLKTGVKRALLLFDCGKGRTSSVNERTGYPAGEIFNEVKFTPYSVDERKPSWSVEAVENSVLGLVGDVPSTFLQVINIEPGSSIRAELKASVKDIEATFVVLADGKALSEAKAKIKKRLRELKIPGGETGDATIAFAEIKFCTRKE